MQIDDLLTLLKCHKVRVTSVHIERLLYRVGGDEFYKELRKLKRYIFFIESGCALNTPFYQEIEQYALTIPYLSGPCLNCNPNEFFNRQFP
jgi:hypothetical protein